jgi:hypothetical protein
MRSPTRQFVDPGTHFLAEDGFWRYRCPTLLSPIVGIALRVIRGNASAACAHRAAHVGQLAHVAFDDRDIERFEIAARTRCSCERADVKAAFRE